MGMVSRTSPSTVTTICPSFCPRSTGASRSWASWIWVEIRPSSPFRTRREHSPLQLRLDLGGGAQQHLHGGQWDIGIDPGERIVGEAVIQKGFGVFKALSGGGRLHHHGDEFHAVPLGGGGDAVQGGIGGTGLEAGGSLIEADQTVGVCETEGTVPDGVHPDGGVLPDAGMVEDQLAGHEGDVVSGGEVALGGGGRCS